jgi:uncharacterized protein
MYYEPLWIFQHPAAGKPKVTTLGELKGLRIAIGAPGSGTNRVARDLLNEAGVSEGSRLLEISGDEMLKAYLAHDIDALFLVGAFESKLVQELLHKASEDIVSLAQAAGASRRHPYLSAVTMPQAAADLALNIPKQDVSMLALTANLVARDELHPALIYLLLDIASTTHGAAGFFNDAKAFPSNKGIEFPLAEEAERFYKNGKPFLQRYLPFWLANFIDRAMILLIPLIAVGLPLIKTLPDLYGYFLKNKVAKWYDELGDIEHHISGQPTDAEVNQLISELDALEVKVNQTAVPGWFVNDVYSLRGAIDLVRERLGRPSDKAIAVLRKQGSVAE